MTQETGVRSALDHVAGNTCLADTARHVIGCHVTQQTRVQSALAAMSLKKRRFKVRWMTWRKSSARPYPRAGEQNSFTIQARDKFQNKKMFGGESFVADFTQSGTTTTVNALDNNDGTYTVQYTLTGSGQGLTLVHFSAQLERFLWDRGYAQGLCSPC